MKPIMTNDMKHVMKIYRLCQEYGKKMGRICLEYASGMRYALRLAAVLLVMIVGVQSAWGQDLYVIHNGTNYLSHNATSGAVNTTRVNTFDPTTCFWTISGNYLRPVNSSGTVLGNLYLRPRSGNSTYSLNTNTSTNYAAWSGGLSDGGEPYHSRGDYYNTYYLRLNNTTWQVSTTNSNNGTLTAVTINNIAAGSLSTFSIDGTSSINTTGTYSNYTHTNASSFAQACTDYYFSDTHHYLNSSNATVTPTTVTTGYTWSLSDNANGYATVNSSTGEVTVTDIPTSGNLTITLTCTVTYNNQTATAEFPITLSITGVSGCTVTLDDREDHNWSYYQASSDLPDGYPTEYLSSPDPRNVKITYRGGSVSGASAVAISALDGEGQNEMVYYKTLEKTVPGMTGNYPYTVISNPFSKRPRTNGSTGTNGFYGFAGWKVVSGGEYISEYANNAVLPLDATIHFINLDTNYTPNCTSGEVVFEATWTAATVKTGNTAQSFTGGTYETNFWVLTGNPGSAITVPANCTMTARYPDGTVSTTTNVTRAITAGGNNAKVEWINMNSTNNVSAANYTFTMGRGIVNSNNGGQLSGCNTNANCVQTVKIESGTYASLYNFTVGLNAARNCDQLMILGCDYDRAKNDNK